MDIEEFNKLYGHLFQKQKVMVVCKCGKTKLIFKEKAIENINNHNNEYKCRSCSMIESHSITPYSEERKKKISNARKGYKQTEEAKKKISEWRKAFYKTPEGKAFLAHLSELTSKQHARKNPDKSKRKVFYISEKNNSICVCASSGEFIVCEDFLEGDANVIKYESQIHYQIDGRHHSLDFLLYLADGSMKVIEVKPRKRLTESKNVIQIADSMMNAERQGWAFELWTEKELNIKNWKVARARADEYNKVHYNIDLAAYRKQKDREKAKRYYDKQIATDLVPVPCEYCNDTHMVLRKTYEAAIKTKGRYICEREGGHIGGSKPKLTLRKENPYAAEGKKECNGCHEVLSFDEFSPDKTKRDDYSTRCKKCRSESQKKLNERKKKNDGKTEK